METWPKQPFVCIYVLSSLCIPSMQMDLNKSCLNYFHTHVNMWGIHIASVSVNFFLQSQLFTTMKFHSHDESDWCLKLFFGSIQLVRYSHLSGAIVLPPVSLQVYVCGWWYMSQFHTHISEASYLLFP